MPETAERLCLAWLACADSLGLKAREKLLSQFPSAQALFERFPASAQEIVGAKAFEELAELRRKGLDKLDSALTKAKIRLAVPGDDFFPSPLTDIPDSPALLFFQGTLVKNEPRAVSLVGSRRETRYGREQAFKIARGLAAKGVTVVSGLARGIDTAAHLGALDAGGRTIAILGSGLLNIYPKENEALAERILGNGGALVSEFAPTAEPLAYRFPIRNRLVSGMSQGVLLVEAREKSGTLITVGHALTQGREVFALPGNVDAPGSEVPLRLLREGARLVTCAEDIMMDLGWQQATAPQASPAPPPPDLTNGQRRLYDALCHEQADFNELLKLMDVPAAQLNVLLTEMELLGLIEALPGKTFQLIRQ